MKKQNKFGRMVDGRSILDCEMTYLFYSDVVSYYLSRKLNSFLAIYR